MVEKVVATEAALQFIEQLKAKHGPLMFHQSGGCCDGSAPMCFREGEFIIGGRDVLLGHIGGCPFYMHAQQYEYWRHTQVVIGVGPGPGSDFSLDGMEPMHFESQARLFTDDEVQELDRG